MNNNLREEQSGEGSNGRFHTVQPLRDLESNWAVDLAQKLEEYLFKICCGEITSDDEGRFSVNFAEGPDALLASIAETEKQSELAARVSTWKQRIEHNLEEQDLHAPFDIHDYGWRVLDKLSLEADSGGGSMSFLDIVRGQEKHDVPRTFSALLQLVNNGNIDLDRGNSSGESVCYAAGNPFYVWLLHSEKRWEEVWLCSSKKRVKSPLRKGCVKGDGDRPVEERHSKFSSSLKFTSMVKSSQPNGKFCVRFGKVSEVRCTPDGKRR